MSERGISNLTPNGNNVAIEMIGVNKWFGAFHVLRDIDLVRRAGQANRHLRPLRLRQIDLDPLHQSA